MRHFTMPQHKGLLQNADRVFVGQNPVCGDSLKLTLRIDSDGKVTDVGWDGSGCALSQASASIFSQMIVGKRSSAIGKMKSEELLHELDIPLSPTRRKCATLILHTFQQGEEATQQ